MILAKIENLAAVWQGECDMGNLFVIVRYENGTMKILHKGCRGWIAHRWKRLTGGEL